MKRRPNLFDELGLIRRPGAVCEKGNGYVALDIYPERSAGIPEMSERTGREMPAGLLWGRGCVPTQSSGGAGGNSLASRKQLNRLRLEYLYS